MTYKLESLSKIFYFKGEVLITKPSFVISTPIRSLQGEFNLLASYSTEDIKRILSEGDPRKKDLILFLKELIKQHPEEFI